jgi:hypothetical protein
VSETHVNADAAVNSSDVNIEPAVNKKSDRREYFRNYMKQYRARQSDKSESQELKSQLEITEPELKPEIDQDYSVAPNIEPQSEPQLEPNKPTAEEYEQKVIKADEAAERLKQLIRAIDQSRHLNQHYAQAQAAQVQQAPLPSTREGRLELWEAQGLPKDEIKFLRTQAPEMIDNPELAAFASAEATQQGFQRGTQAYMERTRELFHDHLRHLQQAQTANAAQPVQPTNDEPAMESTPKFFQPQPALASLPRRQEPSRRSIVSAPVSRQTTATLGEDFERNRGQVHLSAAEGEAARISGITPAEYAKQKLKMLEAKARGEIV